MPNCFPATKKKKTIAEFVNVKIIKKAFFREKKFEIIYIIKDDFIIIFNKIIANIINYKRFYPKI
jgi:hypothetical protein